MPTLFCFILGSPVTRQQCPGWSECLVNVSLVNEPMLLEAKSHAFWNDLWLGLGARLPQHYILPSNPVCHAIHGTFLGLFLGSEPLSCPPSWQAGSEHGCNRPKVAAGSGPAHRRQSRPPPGTAPPTSLREKCSHLWEKFHPPPWALAPPTSVGLVPSSFSR